MSQFFLALCRTLPVLEKKYDAQPKTIFDAVCELMIPLEPKKKRPIRFRAVGKEMMPILFGLGKA